MSDSNYTKKYRDIDFRKHPERYPIGRGEQGVLIAEPYKSELLPHWKFATPELAEISANKIPSMFYEYKDRHEFVGMDLARKFLQMGYTRSRRYANYKGGRKYDGPVPQDKKGQSGAHGRKELPRGSGDSDKAECARGFLERFQTAMDDAEYQAMAAKHKDVSV